MLSFILPIALALSVFVGFYLHSENLEKSLRTTILTLIASTSFLAFYVATDLFFPYITGKGFAFRTLVELMLVFYIPLAFLKPQYRPNKNTGLLVYAVFIAILFIADIFGVNQGSSLWSNYERMEGFVTHIHLFIFTCITVFVALSEKEWNTFFKIFLVGNFLVFCSGLKEMITNYSKLLQGVPTVTRINGPLGNAAYLGIYSAFGIFFATLLYIRIKNKSSFEKLSFISLILMNIVLLWQSQTRGTILGVIAGFGVGLIWFIYKERANKKLLKRASSLLLALVALVVVFIGSRNTAFVQNTKTLKRIADINIGEQTVRSRIMIWEMSYQGFKERPLLGWGQDNFVYVFAKDYNPNMFDQEQWFDRSHDVFFDWLIAGGILGLMAYLALYGITVLYVVQNKKGKLSTGEQVLILGLLTTYFVHNIFVFDNLISYIGFFSLFAFLISEQVVETNKKNKEKAGDSGKGVGLLIGTTVVVGIIWYYIVLVPYTLNSAIIRMYTTTSVATLDAIKSISSSLTMQALYGVSEAREQYLTFAKAVATSNTADENKKFVLGEAEHIFKDEIMVDPNNPRPLVLFGDFVSNLGAPAIGAEYIEKALTITPTKTLLWLQLSQVYIQAGNKEKALEAALKSHTLAPRSLEAAKFSGAILYSLARKEEATTIWNETLAANNSSEAAYNAYIAFLTEIKDESMAATVKETYKTLFGKEWTQ